MSPQVTLRAKGLSCYQEHITDRLLPLLHVALYVACDQHPLVDTHASLNASLKIP